MARVDRRLGGVGLDQAADRLQQGLPVAPRQVGATDRSLEEDVAGEDRVLAADRVGDVAGAVARGEDDVDLEAGKLELLAAGDGLVGVVALERAEARARGRRP